MFYKIIPLSFPCSVNQLLYHYICVHCFKQRLFILLLQDIFIHFIYSLAKYITLYIFCIFIVTLQYTVYSLVNYISPFSHHTITHWFIAFVYSLTNYIVYLLTIVNYIISSFVFWFTVYLQKSLTLFVIINVYNMSITRKVRGLMSNENLYSGTRAIWHLSFLISCDIRQKCMVLKYFCWLK